MITAGSPLVYRKPFTAAQLDARAVNSRDARGFGTRTRKNEGEQKKENN